MQGYFLNLKLKLPVKGEFGNLKTLNFMKSILLLILVSIVLILLSQISNAVAQSSLPGGVTKTWLKNLTDETGNRIIQEEPVTDALQQQTFEGVAAGDNYGKSVASAGDVNGDGFDDVIIGAPKNNAGGSNAGRVYIFFGGTTIDNVADVILTASANEFAGTSVSCAGDVNGDGYDDVIVGAYGYSSFTGRAYICYGGASMNSVADVILTGVTSGSNFGYSVSSAGDVNGDGFSDVIVGAYAYSNYTGKAYIYYGGSAMNNAADVVMTGENPNDNFGYSVSDAGDVNGDGNGDVIAGAFGFNSNFGRTYIYYGSSVMDNIADVTMLGGAITDYFGASVSRAGDVNDDGYSDVIVGAYGNSGNRGQSYIFYGGASMNGIADVTMTGEASNNSFGISVSEAGDVNGDGFADVFVGAYGYSTSKGRTYLFFGGTNMNGTVDIFMTGDSSLNYFGYSVSGGGDVNGDGFSDMIVGAYGKNSNKGRAYVYTNTPVGNDIPDVKFSESLGQFGLSVAIAGDVNGDGFSDVIVGMPFHTNSTGKAYIYFGGIIPDNIPDVLMTGQNNDDSYGLVVSSAGDVNGDNYDDVIVVANRWATNTHFGRAYIYFGGANMNNVADIIIENANKDFEMWSGASAGDVNGDNYDDVIVGTFGLRGNPGLANIYFGSPAMDNLPDVTLTDGISENYGYTVNSAGDVNGDGYSDILVGDDLYGSIGRAYLYYGGASMNTIADVVFTGENFNSLFGEALSGAGDVNGDDYADIVIGAPGYNGGRGRIYIYEGGTAMDNAADIIITGAAPNNYFGLSVSSAGDVNNDGYEDIICGAIWFNATGRAYVFFGNAEMDNIADVIMNGENLHDQFGYSVSGAGDVNGDGKDDLIAGANNYDTGLGNAYLYLSSFPDNRKNLLLYGAIQGMYDPVSNTEIPDTIKVYLRNSVSPYSRIDSSKNILLGPLAGQMFLFKNAINSTPYYIEVTHRNALTTWSASPITFINSDASIAFSVDAIYAYGNNEIQVDTAPYNVFAFYSGDVNQDGTVDITDNQLIDNDSYNFVFGYVSTDLNGDNAVDITDAAIADNNAFNYVAKIIP